MKILQVEDKEEYNLLGAEIVETFQEAQDLLNFNGYDVIVIDGNFPLKPGVAPED